MKNGHTSHSLSEERDHYQAIHSSLVYQAKNFIFFHHKKGIQLCFKRLQNPGTSVYTIMKDL